MITGRRKKRKSKKRIIIFLTIFLFALLILSLILSPIFELKEISVQGNQEVDAEEIKSIITSGNILFLTAKELGNDLLESFPKISEVKVEKNIIKRTVSIVISERESVGITCKENTGNCFYFDKNGFIFEDAPQTSGSLILLIKDFSATEFLIGKKIYSEEVTAMVAEIKEYLASSVNIKTDWFEIHTIPPKEIKTITPKGWYILFDPTRDIKKQLSILKTALNEKIKDVADIEYIDLTIENRIYYK